MPSDPQQGVAWLNEGDIPAVKQWITSLGHETGYIVISRSMAASADYFGEPKGYDQLVRSISTSLGGSVVYRNTNATIYRVNVD